MVNTKRIVTSVNLTMFLGYGETQKYEDLEKLVIAKHAMSSGSIKMCHIQKHHYLWQFESEQLQW